MQVCILDANMVKSDVYIVTDLMVGLSHSGYFRCFNNGALLFSATGVGSLPHH